MGEKRSVCNEKTPNRHVRCLLGVLIRNVGVEKVPPLKGDAHLSNQASGMMIARMMYRIMPVPAEKKVNMA